MLYILLFTALVILFLIDHYYYKNKRFSLLYYKNNHRFSIAVVIRFYHPSLEKLFELAAKSDHDFTFININDTVISEDHPTLKIIDMTVEFDPKHHAHRTKLLSEAYQLAYPHMSKDFLLFMDSEIDIRSFKTLDFMANNLVEHQLFTIKYTIERQSILDSHVLFYDFFRDINNSSDMANYQFFAIKRTTYELAKCHENRFEQTCDFEQDVFKKNITVIHINHSGAFVKAEQHKTFKESVTGMMHYLTHVERLAGLGRMLLGLLAFHLFYASLVLWFMDYIPLVALTYILVHLVFYLTMQPFAKHPPYMFAIAPLLLLWFDVLFIIGLLKRRLHRYHLAKQEKHAALTSYESKTEDFGETAKMLNESDHRPMKSSKVLHEVEKTIDKESDVEIEETTSEDKT